MPSNALLIRWNGGWRERTSAASIAAYGRREALLGLGAVQSTSECDRIADEQLAVYDDVREQITADLEPTPGEFVDMPYHNFLVGDTVTVPDSDGEDTVERVLAITVNEDENGELTFAPELKDVILSAAERLEQAVKKYDNGTMRGDSKVATPVSQVGGMDSTCCPVQPPEGGGG